MRSDRLKILRVHRLYIFEKLRLKCERHYRDHGQARSKNLLKRDFVERCDPLGADTIYAHRKLLELKL